MNEQYEYGVTFEILTRDWGKLNKPKGFIKKEF